jgi:hypothetical protein
MTRRRGITVCARLTVCVVLAASVGLSARAAQQVLDRVLARVGADAVTQSDVRAALGLGLVDGATGKVTEDDVLQRLIDRRLALDQVDQLSAPEPDPNDVAAEVARMKAHAGNGLAGLLESTGLTEARLPPMARDTLRIREYMESRFPPPLVSDADAEEYFRSHPEEFRRNNGTLPSFEEAAPAARDAVAAERRNMRIAQWLGGLRKRADVALPEPR